MGNRRIGVNEVEKQLHGVVEPLMRELEFVAVGSNRFWREVNDVTHTLVWPPTMMSNGKIATSIGWGVRLDDVERIRQRDPEFRLDPTVGDPLHLLHPDKQVNYWIFDKESDIQGNGEDIVAQVKTYALPHLGRFQSAGSILEILKANIRPFPFGCTPQERDALMVYFTYLQEGLVAAEQMALDMLRPLEDKLPKFSRELRKAVERIRKHALQVEA